MANLKPRISDVDNDFKDYLFYDFEVFAHDIFVVFKNYKKEIVYEFHNEEFDNEVLKSIANKHILVGYNNYGYDDHILQSIIKQYPYQMKHKGEDGTLLFISIAKDLNDRIIAGERISPTPEFVSLDCMQQMNVSLKKIEANCGFNIKETDIPFNIDRPLNEKEIELVFKYCETDVDATIDVFKLRWKSYFEPKLQVIELLPYGKDKALRWNTTTITANILTQNGKPATWYEKRLSGESNINQIHIDTQNMINKAPDSVKPLWNSHETTGKQSVLDFNTVFDFGFGGLHGVNKNRKEFRNVKLLDVASMYPNILLNINGLGIGTEIYKDIVNERVRIKHTDPTLSTALKLIINSTYGLLKNKYSKLFNPQVAISVCLYGQIALYSLCKKLDSVGCTIVNVNTDGVAFIDNGHDYSQIWKEWEEEFNLKLELDEFKSWIQKDVNNYLAITKDDKIKVKGKDVKHFYDMTDFSDINLNSYPGDAWNNTNSLGIVTKCVVNKVLYNKEPYETINYYLSEEHFTPILFQMVLQAGSTYKGVFDTRGSDVELQKVNRIFACKDTYSDVITIAKRREDGGVTNFADAPENMMLWNEDLRGIDRKSFIENIDKNFYISKADNVIKRWL